MKKKNTCPFKKLSCEGKERERGGRELKPRRSWDVPAVCRD